MKKESSGTGVTLIKTMSSGAGVGAMFMKRKALEPELCHFYDGFAALHNPKLRVIFLVTFWGRGLYHNFAQG